MIGWLATLSLRWKLLGASTLILLTSLLGFWSLWRVSRRRALNAEARAKQLEEVRRTEQSIRTRQDALRLKQQRLRQRLRVAENRDHFEQGWGP